MENSGSVVDVVGPGVGNVARSFAESILIRPRARRWRVDVQNTVPVVL